jgi:ribosome-associated GTPase EngA
MSFTAVIIGRPNVGKSTFFNRLVGKRLAIVSDTPGVTRDRREGDARVGDLEFRIIDTAGFEDAHADNLALRMQQQTERALEAAEVALFLIDARAGLTPIDAVLAAILRRSTTPVILIANKCEGRAGEPGLLDAFRLGLGEPIPFSAAHGEGMADLYDALREIADQRPPVETLAADEADPAAPLQLAIVGRPNVGKSTLVNRLVGDERQVTGPEAGITRDAIGIDWTHDGRRLRLIDTAGLRRRARVADALEELSVQDTLRAIRFAHVVGIVIDATQGLEKQDLTIARMVAEEGRAPLLVANKWDLVEDRDALRRRLLEQAETSLPQVRGLRLVPLSALTGKGVGSLLPEAIAIYDVWNRQVSTGQLNRWLAVMLERHPPPAVEGRRLRMRYVTQTRIRPPTFVIFGNRPTAVPESYLRYLVNGLRDAFGLDGVPIRLSMRGSRNPYVEGRG